MKRSEFERPFLESSVKAESNSVVQSSIISFLAPVTRFFSKVPSKQVVDKESAGVTYTKYGTFPVYK